MELENDTDMDTIQRHKESKDKRKLGQSMGRLQRILRPAENDTLRPKRNDSFYILKKSSALDIIQDSESECSKSKGSFSFRSPRVKRDKK